MPNTPKKACSVFSARSVVPNKKIGILLCLAALLAGCTGGPVRRGEGERAPVPISASQRNDFDKALALMKKEQYEKAIPLLEAILAENDRLPGTHINLAIAYMNLDGEDEDSRYRKAEDALLQAVEIDPREAVAQHQLGLLYRKTGRLEQALQAYEKALKIDPEYAMAHYNLAVLCDIYLQQLECAIEHFEAYRRLLPEGESEQSEKVGLWLADLRRRAGVPEPAEPATDGA